MPRLLGALLLAALAGCGSLSRKPKPKEPAGAMQGALFGSVVLRGHEFPNVIPHRAVEVFFAQVRPDGTIDVDHPLLSNFTAGGQVYLLDVPPGKYVPLTVSYYHRRLRYMARLPPEEALVWAVDVGPGQIAFFGENTLRTEWQGFARAALDWLKQALAHVPPFPHFTSPVEISTPRKERAPEVEAHALRQAREALKGTLWIPAIDARLTALGNPPDPETTGLIFKKKKPKLGKGAFKYTETLGWGKPLPGPGGLRWLEPKKRAEIVVSYMTPDVPGYKPKADYLQDMTTAGNDEDTHVLHDVMISSRSARVARYTTYLYPQGTLPGSEVKVFKTETWLVPAAEGYYILRYRALREDFHEFYPKFVHFIQYVEYEVPLEPRPTASLDGL